ncbi:MAG: integrase core domain-containing protein [Steroidobacteraceae bacterium]
MFSGWVNRQQLNVIEYLQEENRVLKARLGQSGISGWTRHDRQHSQRNGIDPAPQRDAHTRWSTFLKAHWECFTATDFLSVEVFTLEGLITPYILLFVDIASRSVHVAGITRHPDNAWMTQIARNVTDTHDGFLRDKRYLIMDRDTIYSDAFRGIITRAGTDVVRLPPRSPNLNAFAERFVRSIKEECLNRMIFVGQASLRHAITEYLTHYHGERNHQGLENRLLKPFGVPGEPHAPVKRRERLGGMLSY